MFFTAKKLHAAAITMHSERAQYSPLPRNNEAIHFIPFAPYLLQFCGGTAGCLVGVPLPLCL